MAIPMYFHLKCACCGVEQRESCYGYRIHGMLQPSRLV